MSSTMLQLIQQATGEMGVAVPTYVAGNTTQDVVQQLALLNAVGYELERQCDWQRQTVLYTFQTSYLTTTGDLTNGSAVITNIPTTASITTDYQVTGNGVNNAAYVYSVDSGTQVTMTQQANASGTGVTLTFSKVKFDFPADFDRLIDRTDWDKTQHWEMLGPETAQQWEWLISGYISTGPRVRFRVLGNKFQIWPAQGTQHTLGFEYVSNYFVISTGATQPDKSSFTADTDTCIFPDRLMVLGLKKKYFEIKGFDTTAMQRDYDMQLQLAKSNDKGSQNLSFAPKISTILIGWNQIPDSGYGS